MQFSETILVVEDCSDDVLSLACAFRRLGISIPVRVVPNGFAAIQYFNAEGPYRRLKPLPPPRLTLISLDLPLLSGFEFLDWLRRKPGLRHLPVVAITQSDFQEDLDRADESGANHLLIKSPDFEAYTSALKQVTDFWLGRHQLVALPLLSTSLLAALEPVGRRPNLGWTAEEW